MKEVTAAVLRRGQKVLLTRRAAGETQAGCWEFPGGKVDEGETPQESLVRELMEELNLECSVGDKLAESEYRYEHGSFVIMAYEAEIISGSMKLSVHDRAEWVAVEKLTGYHLSPADILIAETVQRLYGSI